MRSRGMRQPGAAFWGLLAVVACSGTSPAMPGGESGADDPVLPPAAGGDQPWPGPAQVAGGDERGTLGKDLSGLVWVEGPDGAAQLWAVQNQPGRLFRLVGGVGVGGADGQGGDGPPGVWRLEAPGSWASPRQLRYPSGAGSPDAEGVTAVGPAGGHDSGGHDSGGHDPGVGDDPGMLVLYVAAERDNEAGGLSRNSVLRYEVDPHVDPLGASGTELVATHEWNLTDLLPGTAANGGLEAIAWVPDEVLVANGLVDERTGEPYAPEAGTSHAGGLFFVGIEDTGEVQALALDHDTGLARIVQRIAAPFDHVTALEADLETGELLLLCDDRCSGRTAVLRVGTGAPGTVAGRYSVVARHRRPEGADNWNVEGLAIAPRSYCSEASASRAVIWADDGATADHALRVGAFSCEY